MRAKYGETFYKDQFSKDLNHAGDILLMNYLVVNFNCILVLHLISGPGFGKSCKIGSNLSFF